MIGRSSPSSLDLVATPSDFWQTWPRRPEQCRQAFRSLLAVVIRVLLRLYLRFEISGREHVPADESCVIVANHSSHLDVLCLLAALPRHRLPQAYSAAAADYFFQSSPRRWLAAMFGNALPFARQDQVRESLALCAKIVSVPGNILIIFPEGTRSTVGSVQDFKSGVATLVAGRALKVIPCFIEGASRAWPKGGRIPRPRKVRLHIGRPRQYSTRTAERNDLIAITADLRQAVIALSGNHGRN